MAKKPVRYDSLFAFLSFLRRSTFLMSDKKNTTNFWTNETCEYCNGPIVEKQVTVYRKLKGHYVLFEHVPAGVCKECGTRYYAANVLKLIEEGMRGRQKVAREELVPIYSF